MVEAFGDGIWTADGPVVGGAAGFRFPTRMAILKGPDGGLMLWSPVALTASLKAGIEDLGEVRALVAPNTLHHVFLGAWQAACPGAVTLAVPGLRDKRPDLRIDADLVGGPVKGWRDAVDLVIVTGNRLVTEAVLYHRASRTVLFVDLLQNFPAGWFTGWRGLVARLDLMVGDEPRVPRKFRVAMRDRAAARSALERIRAWPAERVLMAHGDPIRENGRTRIEKAFAWLR